MPVLVYSMADPVSSAAAEVLINEHGFGEKGEVHGLRRFGSGRVDLLELKEIHVNSEYLDKYIDTDAIVFISGHRSAKGVPAFTTHPEGNWGGEAKYGGKPSSLSMAAPDYMLRMLKSMRATAEQEVAVTYEATHHGPLLDTPSLYAEVGGSPEARADPKLAGQLAKSVIGMLDTKAEYEKVALGIGGLHYEDRFARLALKGKYAFSHMMSKHYASHMDMIAHAAERSRPKPEIAVIEWKSLSPDERASALARLNDIGMEYERI